MLQEEKDDLTDELILHYYSEYWEDALKQYAQANKQVDTNALGSILYQFLNRLEEKEFDRLSSRNEKKAGNSLGVEASIPS